MCTSFFFSWWGIFVAAIFKLQWSQLVTGGRLLVILRYAQSLQHILRAKKEQWCLASPHCKQGCCMGSEPSKFVNLAGSMIATLLWTLNFSICIAKNVYFVGSFLHVKLVDRSASFILSSSLSVLVYGNFFYLMYNKLVRRMVSFNPFAATDVWVRFRILPPECHWRTGTFPIVRSKFCAIVQSRRAWTVPATCRIFQVAQIFTH